MTERERDREGSVSSLANESSEAGGQPAITIPADHSESSIDVLFEKQRDQDAWDPPKPPQVLGELLDSRYMLPLLFPSDPRMLAALPGKLLIPEDDKRLSPTIPDTRSTNSRVSMDWRARNRKLREVGVATLKWIDGTTSVSRWSRPLPDEEEDEGVQGTEDLHVDTNITPLTRKPSGRSKGKPSIGEDQTTPIDRVTTLDGIL